MEKWFENHKWCFTMGVVTLFAAASFYSTATIPKEFKTMVMSEVNNAGKAAYLARSLSLETKADLEKREKLIYEHMDYNDTITFAMLQGLRQMCK